MNNIIGKDQISKDKNSIVLDYHNNEPDTSELPNVENILDNIILILEFMDTTEMKNIKKTDQNAFEEAIEEKFPDFINEYYSVYRMLISGEDLEPLFKMLETLGNIDKGQVSFEEGEKNVGKYLKKFLPDDLVDEINKHN